MGLCHRLCFTHGAGVGGKDSDAVGCGSTAAIRTTTDQVYLMAMGEGNTCYFGSAGNIVSNDYHGCQFPFLLFILFSLSIDGHAGGIVDGERHGRVVGDALAGNVEGRAVVDADTDDGQTQRDVDT